MRFLHLITFKGVLSLLRTQSWLTHSVLLLCLLLIVHAPPCQGQQQLQDVRLTSTEYNLTVTFTPNPAATNYTVSFRLKRGFIFTDFPFSPPFNSSELSQTYTAVLPGHVYTIEIFENETTVGDRVFAKDMATVPLTPLEVEVASRGNDFLLLQWVSDQNFTYDGHEIGYDRENGNPQVVRTPSDLTYNLTGLEAGYSYDIYVVAFTLNVKSKRSLRLTTATIPLAPVNVSAVAVDTNQINITWLPDPNSYQDSYIVNYTLPGSELEQSTLCVVAPCVFSPQSMSGQTISISVYSESNSLISLPATTQHSTAPGNLRGLVAEERVRSLYLSWIAPKDSYQVFYVIKVTGILDKVNLVRRVNADKTSYKLDSLIGGSVYQVHVQAQSEFELGQPLMANFKTLPEPVTNLSGSAVNTSAIQFTWTNPAFSKVDKLNISVYTQDEVLMMLEEKDVTTTSYTVSNLQPGVSYNVSITVVSEVTNASTPAITVIRTKPVPPAIVKVIAGETFLTLTLASSADGDFDSLQAMLDGEIVQHIADANGLVTFSDLEPGMEYIIRSFSLSGQVQSDEIISVFFTRPQPVSDLKVFTLGERSLSVEWSEPDKGGYDNFTVLASDVDGINSPMTIITGDQNTTFKDLQPGTTYNISVVVLKGDQQSEAVWELNTTDPESVAALQKVESLTNSITVNWTAPTSVNIDYFQLGIQPVDPATRPIPRPMNVAKNQTSTTFEGLEPGLEYTIAIRTAKLLSRNRAQFGESVKLQAVTKPLPVQELIAETINTTAVSLRWETNSTSRQNRFIITYSADDTFRSLPKPASNESGQSYVMEIGQLLPGYSYSISVVAIRAIETDLAESDEGSVLGFTVPSPVRNLTLRQEEAGLVVTWLPPPASGSWQSYEVEYRPTLRDNETKPLSLTASQSQNTLRIPDLFPGEKYEVKVSSTSNRLKSEPTEAYIVFNPLPPSNFEHAIDLTTTEGITLKWVYNMESTYTESWSITISDGQFRDDKTVEANTNQKEYSLSWISLVPGQTYTVSIKALVNDKESDPQTLDATTKPVINSDLSSAQSTNSSVSLRYTVSESDIFDQLDFYLGEDEHKIKDKEDPQRLVTFNGLEAGTKYTVQVVTLSKGQRSEPKSLELITEPNPVPVVFSSTSTSIVLTLGPQVGGAKDYVITCSLVEAESTNTESCGEQTVQAGTDTQDVTFDSLRPYQKYLFNVLTRADMLREEQKETSRQYNHTTDEAAPSVVRSLRVQAQGIHSVFLEWQAPAMANGRLRSYTVAYLGSEPSDPTRRDSRIITNISVGETSKRVDNLQAGFEYKFSVFAITIAQGEVAETSITMGTTTPAFRPGLSALKAKPALLDSSTGGVSAATETKISLTFTNPFSTDNGNVRYYTVIVSKDPSATDSSLTLPSWADAQADSSIQVYQALDQCEDFFSAGSKCGQNINQGRRRRAVNSLDSRTFIIGEEQDCAGKTYCNGPLSSDTEYYVKLRGFTASGKFQETAYSEKIRTAKKSSSNAGMAAGIGTTVAVLAVVGVVVVVIVVRRRRRPKRATKHVGPKANWEQSTMCKFSRPVKLSDFPAHVRKMEADSDFKYAEEYEDLKEVGRDQPCLAAEFPPNRPKNRFTNILPYDHSRVKLSPTDDDEGSDYINANYLPGFNSKREYIATQGPLPATRDDLWRMVWEQSARNIVMLTRCLEKGREKSDHYWPNDSDPKFYGDLHVVVLNETHMPDWTVTELRVSLGEQSRNVRHFHYKVWPDFGVPEDHTSLIRFIRMVRERLVREGGPIITHCSAGVGRSGTFIVLDHLLQMIREKDEVDIFSIVYKLRKERVLMVQTEKQYKFIHECLLCVLEGKEDDTTYANVGQINVGFDDDEGINIVETP